MEIALVNKKDLLGVDTPPTEAATLLLLFPFDLNKKVAIKVAY
jgi:hypothetical protein